MEEKDILGWCFTVAALNFGVFGFLYSTYASAMFQLTAEKPIPPPIARYLKLFCRVTALVLAVLTVLSAYTSFVAATPVGYATGVIVACFVTLTAFSLRLAYKMD